MMQTKDYMCGKKRHQTLIQKGRNFIEKREESDVIESNTPFNPDICLSDSSVCEDGGFNEVWFEAEASTAKKPSHIIRKVVQAAKSKSKLVFLVPAVPDKRVDYYASRISNIIGPPSLRRGYNDSESYRLYNSSEPLRTEEEKLVLTEFRNGSWIYDEKQRILRYESGGKNRFEVKNPNESLAPEDPDFVGYFENEQFVVEQNGNVNKYNSINNSELSITNRPAYPFSIPRNRLRETIDSVEYLIFGENLTYHKIHPKIESYIDGLN